MKHGVVFVLASSLLLAAVAAAHIVAPLPDAAPFQSSAKAASASDSSFSSPKSPGDMPVSKHLMEARQAPVPLQMRERSTAVLTQTVETAAAAMPAAAAPSDVEAGSFARSAIEADGYKSVKNIVAGPGGTWQAHALRGKTEVVLRVDQDGRVAAD